MNTLIIYDNAGYIISTMAGSIREPQGGVQFLWVEIPEGKQLKVTDGIGVDVSVTPNIPILENIPKSSEKVIEIRMSNVEDAVNAIMTI
ncbi:hypothetical protein GH810_14485 [Acetobacterium paludosum]|uniref:Uncharacterized protein n=1 Tax=Acetobacterium paludosum TaxID=52693 RepID=A0A923KXL9_9FIRM|nr:hypothetical protein [Acetobacterium paludosum]MBC3889518.1 hypothetical protein [Acetobacterium paludosum]